MNRLTVTSKQVSVMMLLSVSGLCGCGGFRYAATEAQKENAWLHERVCAVAAETAAEEAASQTLCGLTELAHRQSGTFVADYGVPSDTRHGQAELDRATLEAVVTQAKADSLRKPDAWALADSAMELGVAVAGLLGGVYGIRVAGYLKQAREKSRALKEIVEGNELFKQLWPEQRDRFKEAQRKQSPATKQIVTELKAS